jgi:hypothetical protein
MNQRERILAIILGAIAVLGGGYVLVAHVYQPALDGRDNRISQLDKDLATKEKQVRDAQAKKKQLDDWRKQSLPSNVNLSLGEYEKYLRDLFVKSGFQAGSFSIKHKEPAKAAATPAARAKKQSYSTLTFTVQGHGNLESLVKMFEGFHRTPLLHQVKTIDLLRPSTPRQDYRTGDLEVTLTIEALLLEGAENRDTLVAKEAPAPTLLAAAARTYSAIAARNIFFGIAQPPPASDFEGNRYVYLTDITRNEEGGIEAVLYDRYNNQEYVYVDKDGSSKKIDAFEMIRIRSTGPKRRQAVDKEFDALAIPARQVVRIDDKEILFKVADKFHALGVGKSVYEAMSRALRDEDVKAKGLTPAKAE